jgi:hypothetical protein
MCQDSIHRGLRKLIPGKDFVSGELDVTFWTVTIPQARRIPLNPAKRFANSDEKEIIADR